MPHLTLLRQAAEETPVVISLDWPAILTALGTLIASGVAWYKARQEYRKGKIDVMGSLERSVEAGIERGFKLNTRIATLEDDLFATKKQLRETVEKLDKTQSDLNDAQEQLAETKAMLAEARGVIDSQREYIENVEAEKADIMCWAEELVGQLKEANIEPIPFRWRSRPGEPPVPASGRRK